MSIRCIGKWVGELNDGALYQPCANEAAFRCLKTGVFHCEECYLHSPKTSRNAWVRIDNQMFTYSKIHRIDCPCCGAPIETHDLGWIDGKFDTKKSAVYPLRQMDSHQSKGRCDLRRISINSRQCCGEWSLKSPGH